MTLAEAQAELDKIAAALKADRAIRTQLDLRIEDLEYDHRIMLGFMNEMMKREARGTWAPPVTTTYVPENPARPPHGIRPAPNIRATIERS